MLQLPTRTIEIELLNIASKAQISSRTNLGTDFFKYDLHVTTVDITTLRRSELIHNWHIKARKDRLVITGTNGIHGACKIRGSITFDEIKNSQNIAHNMNSNWENTWNQNNFKLSFDSVDSMWFHELEVLIALSCYIYAEGWYTTEEKCIIVYMYDRQTFSMEHMVGLWDSTIENCVKCPLGHSIRANDRPLFLGPTRPVIDPACCIQSNAHAQTGSFSFWPGPLFTQDV